MSTKEIFVCIIFLALCALSCQAIMVVVATPTAEPTPIPTDTLTTMATKPNEMATAFPQVTPISESNHIPVINSIDLRPETAGGEMTVYQDISFKDADGDVYYVDYELKSATTEGLRVEDGDVKIPLQEQQSGAKLTGDWICGSNNYEVTLIVRLYDKAGNKSSPYECTIVCNLGAVVASSFPDQFDDNRNGWELDDEISIKDGMLRFRNIPESQSRWTWCDACRVTSDQNTVSVEASWSNTPNASLGLLIDDDSCTPDGLVFIIEPQGYYSILQAVRDESGEWRHWRHLIDWTKSILIRKAQNAKNVISVSYEFGDELHVIFFLNESRVTRVRVYGYNGSKECRPGLFADGGLEANFDNFSISPANP